MSDDGWMENFAERWIDDFISGELVADADNDLFLVELYQLWVLDEPMSGSLSDMAIHLDAAYVWYDSLTTDEREELLDTPPKAVLEGRMTTSAYNNIWDSAIISAAEAYDYVPDYDYEYDEEFEAMQSGTKSSTLDDAHRRIRKKQRKARDLARKQARKTKAARWSADSHGTKIKGKIDDDSLTTWKKKYNIKGVKDGKIIFNAPYAGLGALFKFGGNDSALGGFTAKELTESSAIHGDFDSASLNYSGHQNIEVRQSEEVETSWVTISATMTGDYLKDLQNGDESWNDVEWQYRYAPRTSIKKAETDRTDEEQWRNWYAALMTQYEDEPLIRTGWGVYIYPDMDILVEIIAQGSSDEPYQRARGRGFINAFCDALQLGDSERERYLREFESSLESYHTAMFAESFEVEENDDLPFSGGMVEEYANYLEKICGNHWKAFKREYYQRNDAESYSILKPETWVTNVNNVLITGSVGGDPAMFFFERGTADNNGFTPGMILVGDKNELTNRAASIYDSISADRFQQGFKNYKNNVWRSKRSFLTEE